MRKKLIPLSFLMCLAIASHASQPHPFYSHFYTQDGLPDVGIVCCAQDVFGRIWIGSRGEGVYYYAGSRFVQLLNDDYLSTCSMNTTAIVEDIDDNIWIGTSRGIGYYDTRSDDFYSLDELSGERIKDIDVDKSGNVWITVEGGIWMFSKEDRTVSCKVESDDFSPSRTCISGDDIIFTAENRNIYRYVIADKSLRLTIAGTPSSSFRYIEPIDDETVLVSDNNKTVSTVKLSDGKTTEVVDSNQIENVSEVRCLLYRNDLFWIGTTYGLIVYDPETEDLERQFPDILDESTLGGENILCLYQDLEGNMWAGTLNGGLRCWMSYEEGFGRFISNDYANSLTGNTIRAISSDSDNRIWIGSEEGYICSFNPYDRSFKDYTSFSNIPYGTSITSIKCIGHNLWISTSGDGVYVFDPEAGHMKRHYDVPSIFCMSLAYTHDGILYTGTASGLFVFNSEADKFTKVEVLGETYINCLAEDKDGHLLVGTNGQGVGIFDINSETFINDILDSKDVITNLSFDSKGNLWITTDGNGVCLVEGTLFSDHYDYKRFDRTTGMPSNRAGAVVEDDDGTIWIATTNGLVEFDSNSLSIRKIFMQNDKVLGSKFSFGGSFISDDAVIYLGSSNGLLVYDPQYIKVKFKDTPLHITDIVMGSPSGIKSAAQNGKSAITSEELKVKQKEASFISIAFSGMDYSSPNRNTYQCTLTRAGFKSQLTGTDGFISYNSLRPGVYDFTVNYLDSDDPSTEAGIKIVMLAPWYLSKIAKIIYVFLLFGTITFLLFLKDKKKEKETTQRMELIEAKKEKDLAHEKMDFFTNVAHEIRTPLSVILILLDKIKKHAVPWELSEDMNSIYINAERLKKQCDELLDFRKVEKGFTRMVFVNEDIREIAERTIKSFDSASAMKGIAIEPSLPDVPVIVSCDASAVESIFCNLLSNAIKYGRSRIQFILKESSDSVCVRVNSDGNKIPYEESERIFDAFYQSKGIENSGTGIGLTYSRQLASFHNGKLYLDNSVLKMNSFVLELPKNYASVKNKVQLSKDNDLDIDSRIDDDIMDSGQNATILVVEDNLTMRDLIRDELSKSYDILVAGDGEEALSIVKQGKVDLVVSDIMMPKIDGCELCNTIKDDIQLSHIPVLLLTAAVGVETHIRSLKSGADAYFEKPFKMDVLTASISNLFRNRDIRNQQFSSYPLSHISYSSFSKVEQDFMNTLHNFIVDNLSDTDLTIEKLSSVMSVSRNTLTRKVKANVGLTVNEYVRICRLKKAVELLTENNYRINEVAYLVGYSSPSYFTKSFQKQFGKLPSEFVKKD